jgi:hypothetical protein
MHLLNEQAHNRFDRAEVADRRSNQQRKWLAAQIGNAKIALARCDIDKGIVPGVQRRCNMGSSRILVADFC